MIRVVEAKPLGLPGAGIGYYIIGEWTPPEAANEQRFGDPEPDAPKQTIKPKLKRTK